jgi:ribosomal protein S18 acetylase RimI-like enzyme
MDRMRPDQQVAASLTLAEAFQDDPMLRLLVPNDDRKRRAIAPWFFANSLKYGTRWGQVWSNDDASAVAVWLPPAQSEIKPLNMLRVGMGMLPFKVGLAGTKGFLTAVSATEAFHSAVGGPHWYLFLIGARRSSQGQGLGSELLEVGMSQASASSLPCYLETTTESNVAFYSKRGFQVIGQAEVAGITMFGMSTRR